MIIKSATRLAFAAGCLAAITTLSAAHAQMGYWSPPGPYGPAPGAYGPPRGAYGPAPGTYAPQANMSRHQAPMLRRASMSRRPPQTRPEPSW